MISPARKTRAEVAPKGACTLPLGNPSAYGFSTSGEDFSLEHAAQYKRLCKLHNPVTNAGYPYPL